MVRALHRHAVAETALESRDRNAGCCGIRAGRGVKAHLMPTIAAIGLLAE